MTAFVGTPVFGFITPSARATIAAIGDFIRLRPDLAVGVAPSRTL